MAKIASELQSQMNAMANDEPIPVIVRRKSGVFSAQALLPSAPAIDHAFNLFPGEACSIVAADIESPEHHPPIAHLFQYPAVQ